MLITYFIGQSRLYEYILVQLYAASSICMCIQKDMLFFNLFKSLGRQMQRKRLVKDGKGRLINTLAKLCLYQVLRLQKRMMVSKWFRGKQHQISCGDNYSKLYILELFNRISITLPHRVWVKGLGSGGVVGWLYVRTLITIMPHL